MTLLQRNIAANFCGGIWTALMGLVFVPLYIHFIGIEAYGLIGIFVSLLALFGLLDMGLSSTLNREMAQMSVQEGKAQDMRDLVRTLEIPYWGVGLLISFSIIGLSPVVAYHWVNVKNLSPQTVHTAILIMGFAVAFQWPISFYSGGLLGLQRQVLLNGINAAMATVRGLGAVVVLWRVSPTVEAFFLWQIAVSAAHVGMLVFFLKRQLPGAPEPPRFRPDLLRRIGRFATGLTGIAVTVTILTQLDKVILSRMLSLDMFGYYTLASAVAMNLSRFVSPVFQATYPRFSNLVALGSTAELVPLYHKSAQLVSVLVLPVALVVALFSKEILLLWTQNPVTADNARWLVSILVLGTAIHGLMHIPYALQLAYGWTRLAFQANVVFALFLAPLIVLLARTYGAIGAACVWLMLNLGYLCVSLPIMHRRLLPAEKWRWYIDDVGRPLGAAAAVCLTGRWIIRSDWPPAWLLAGLGLVSGVALLAAAGMAPRLEAAARIKPLFNMLRTRKEIHPA